MVTRLVLSAFVCLALLSGCSTIKLSERNTSIVMAKDAKKGEGPSGISDRFGMEGKIVAFVTFRWDEVSTAAGRQEVEAKWFAGDKLVSAPKYTYDFGKPPHYVYFSTQGTAIGLGKGRVEIYVDGIFVGSKTFEVVEKM